MRAALNFSCNNYRIQEYFVFTEEKCDATYVKASVMRKWCIHLHFGCKLNLLVFLCTKYSIVRLRATCCPNVTELLKFCFRIGPAVLFNGLFCVSLVIKYLIFSEREEKHFDLRTLQAVSCQHSLEAVFSSILCRRERKCEGSLRDLRELIGS